MREFSLLQLNRQSGDVTNAARSEPVALTHHRKPRFVLMSYEQYQKLTTPVADTRRVYGVDEIPDDVADWLLPSLDRFADGEDLGGG